MGKFKIGNEAQVKSFDLENGEVDLVNILKNVPQETELFCDIYGIVEFDCIDENNTDYPINIITTDPNGYRHTGGHLTRYGKYSKNHPEGKCILWPSETCRDWSKFKAPRPDLPVDTPCMVWGNNYDEWMIRYYAGNHRCFVLGKSENNTNIYNRQQTWKHIIPTDKFDFNDMRNNFGLEWDYGTENKV